MKKRQAVKILKNWPRFCYKYEQLYDALNTMCHMKNQRGIRPRRHISEGAFRDMVWSLTLSFKHLNDELQLKYGA